MLVVILVIFAGVGFFVYKKINQKTATERAAVFLTNGQVYFGDIVLQDDSKLVLKDIYYLRNTSDQNDPSKKVSIVKLGEELHGPTDQMYINRQHILFYEKMRENSKVNSAINQYVSAKGQN